MVGILDQNLDLRIGGTTIGETDRCLAVAKAQGMPPSVRDVGE